jgi:pimeloyl-ACP methyl ester carboxylesterase
MEMLGSPRVTEVGGTAVAWTELGSGPPLVLLHGLADSHRTWRSAAPALATRFRVLMPDLPGHGLSSRPDAPYTLDWYARTMLAWLDAAEVHRAHLLGHSFGGGVAQWMVLEQRARVDRLVLEAPGGLGPEVSMGLRLASFPKLGQWLAQPLMGIGTHVMMRLAGQGAADEIARAAWLNRAPGTGMAFHRTVSGCIDLMGQRLQTWDRIHDVDLPPMALLWGERDPVLPFRQALRAHGILQGAAFARYEGVGHFPHLERADQFSRDVEGFLVGPCEPARVRVHIRLPQPGRVRRLVGRLGAAIRRIFSRRSPRRTADVV